MPFPTDDPHDRPMPIDFYVWVAKSDKRTVLIDSGADADVCAARNNKFLRCPSEGLKLLGIDLAPPRRGPAAAPPRRAGPHLES
jgi:hypothetical protein